MRWQRNLDREYQQYGYTGFTDNIKYDEWTHKVIPKNEIGTYNNNNKYITKSNGEKVYFANKRVISYLIHLKDFNANGKYYDDYSIGPAFEMENSIKYLVKEIYRE